MVRKTKWIENSAPDQPVDDVARRALSARLESVWQLLSRAGDDDPAPEHVHQLRVATRRAMAALRIFAPLLPPRRARKMKKQLKRIRLVAGDARNLDVLGARLESEYPAWDSEHIARLDKFLNGLRKAAQPPIEKLYAHLKDRSRFVRRSKALVERVRIREAEPAIGEAADDHESSQASEAEQTHQPHTFAAAARKELGSLVDQFFIAAGADFSAPAALHTMRICGKRVRYGIEIFGGAFGPALRQEIYPLVVEIQEKLGSINDHVTAADLFAGWLTATDDSELAEILKPLIAQEQRAIELRRHEFLAWWTTGRAAELRRRFDQQLADHAHEQSA